MAEISYPFNVDNANGGTAVVSQTQWQSMAHMWGGDRVDFQLTSTTYTTLPFEGRVLNSRLVEVQPGKAFVGGFYYQLTSPQSVAVPENPGDKPRMDLVVIQADISKGSVNLAVRTGTPGATPVAPQPRRQAGGIWEMPLYEVSAGARNGPIALTPCAPFDVPAPAAYPWNMAAGLKYMPVGTFVMDMDSNTSDTQYEGFKSRDGYTVSRTLGKSLSYTPSIVGGQSPSAPYRVGRFRWIAPNTVFFSASIRNITNTDLRVSKGNWVYGITLPEPANGKTGQVVSGIIDNGSTAAGLPNVVDLKLKISRGNTASTAYMWMPGTKATNGLDALTVIPRKSEITISGTYEAAQFKE
ncbi:hypothetical protein OG897_08450 [Streptomyces sp. NBC_00237]|uniref:hypothetical protein n=1 Tax=Streptomyces sp. NBC_00237 TaxID=2975687 RepID=UPI00225A96FF|nr:hypothetical protein [Streptomyces sp. NBC_00237]MCX5201481.1 hypothetical protein [Streptomyces sp. NBC_00237]